MYYVEINQDGNWIRASSHTNEIDRDVQFERFVSNGMDVVRLRKSED